MKCISPFGKLSPVFQFQDFDYGRKLVITAYYKHRIIPDFYRTKKKSERPSRGLFCGI
jgi:hypothetical protein